VEAAEEVLAIYAEQLTEKNPTNGELPFALSTVKSALMVIAKIWESRTFRKDRSSIYGFTVRSGEGDTMTKLQTPKSPGELVVSIVASIINAGADTYSTLSADKEDEEEATKKAKEEAEKKGETFDEAAFAKDYKKATLYNTFGQNSADFIAEIVAIVVLYCLGASLDKAKMGGILLHAEDANIGLHAKDAIHLDTEGGLLLRSGRGNLLNKLTQNYTDPARSEPILKWGSMDSGTPGFAPEKLFNFYNHDAMAYVFDSDAKEADIQQLGFLADLSTLRYTDTDNLAENVTGVRKSLAKKHIVMSGATDNGNAIVVQEAQSEDYQKDGTIQSPSKKGAAGVYIGTKGEGRKITLKIGGGGEPGPKMKIKDKEWYAQYKKSAFIIDSAENMGIVAADNTSILVNKEKIILTVQDKSSLVLQDGKIGLSCDSGEYTLGGVKVDGKKGALTGVTDIGGGAIKIMGTCVSVKQPIQTVPFPNDDDE
jgi:hypothetical protein